MENRFFPPTFERPDDAGVGGGPERLRTSPPPTLEQMLASNPPPIDKAKVALQIEEHWDTKNFRPHIAKMFGQARALIDDASYAPREDYIVEIIAEAKVASRNEQHDIKDLEMEFRADGTFTAAEAADVARSYLEIQALDQFIGAFEAISLSRTESAEAKGKIVGKVEELIDARDKWGSFARIQKWVRPGEDPTEERWIAVIHARLMQWLITIHKNSYSRNVHNEQGPTDYFSMQVGDLEGGGGRQTLGQILDVHPKAGQGHNSEGEIRRFVELLGKAAKGSKNWEHITEISLKQDKFFEHLEEYMWTGEEWAALYELPKLSENDFAPSGEIIAEGLYLYSHWNEKFIKMDRDEVDALELRVKADIASGAIRVPSQKDLQAAMADFQVHKDFRRIPFKTGIDTKKLTSQDILLEWTDGSKLNYADFVRNFTYAVIRIQKRDIETARQKKFGIHPAKEVSDMPDGSKADDVSTSAEIEIRRTAMRNQIRIGMGVYRLWGGYYKPIDKFASNGTGQVVEMVMMPDGSGGYSAPRPISADERRQALEASEDLEIISYQMYESQGLPVWDDNVTFATSYSSVTKLANTAPYRTRYAQYGREGFNRNSIPTVRKLIPHPLMYQAADGVNIYHLLGERDKRAHANYELLKENRKKALLEMLGYAFDIYKDLQEGNADILELATVTVEGVAIFGGSEYLKFAQDKIQKLMARYTSVYKYFIRTLETNIDDVKAGTIYDPDIWHPVPGTKYASPLWDDMFRFSEEDILLADIKRRDMQSAYATGILVMSLIEGLVRSFTRTVELSDAVAMRKLLANVGSNLYGQRRGADEGIQVELRGVNFGEVFGLNERQVAYILKTAGLRMRTQLETFLSEQAGV